MKVLVGIVITKQRVHTFPDKRSRLTFYELSFQLSFLPPMQTQAA